MGNRAVITASTAENVETSKDIGVYVHWSGDRPMVEAFLLYCKAKGYRVPEKDNYGWAYLVNVITNYFGNGLSCGIDTCNHLDCDNNDNGVYIIKEWEIVDRKFFNGDDFYGRDIMKIISNIDERQPSHIKLTPSQKEYIKYLLSDKKE